MCVYHYKCLTCLRIFRWLAAVKVSHGANKDLFAAAAKADTLKEEYEEETAKFEACQVSSEFYRHLMDSILSHALEMVISEI